MSQLPIFKEEKDPLDVPIVDESDLISIFKACEKPKNKQLMGIEYEVFGFIKNTTTPLPFIGPISIQSFFSHLKKVSNFKAIIEDGQIVAMSSPKAVLALEPGGQLEIAASPQKSLFLVIDEFRKLIEEFAAYAHDANIDLLAMGFHPTANLEDMAQVKKTRYDIMEKYMKSLNGRGLDMMKRSCSIQVNIDYENEIDMRRKVRTAAILMPLLSALFSLGPFVLGKPSSKACERADVWLNTDKDRTGLPAFIFDKEFGYQDWINYALDVPMYFIRRNNNYIDVTGKSFREFISKGLKGQKARLRDFQDHLSVIFTEVRLKPFLELRGCDSLPAFYVKALATLVWHLFYDDENLQVIEKKIENISHKDVIQFRLDSIDNGIKAKLANRTAQEILEELVTLALSKNNSDYLISLMSLIKTGSNPAQWAKSQFDHIGDDNFKDMLRFFAPLAIDYVSPSINRY